MRTVLLILALLSIPGALAKPARPINVLVLHWYDRSYPSNDAFDRTLQAALQSSAQGGVEYYSEYLETPRFPGDAQERVLSDYLRQKYAGRRIDVVVTDVSYTLDFLLKFRGELFPNIPIVFATDRRLPAGLASQAGATGFVYASTYAETLDLALKWHPRTKQLFVVSGTLNHDKALESIVRDELRLYESTVAITYLTDLSPDELTARIGSLPEESLILYVWQQVRDRQGRLLEAHDVLARIAREAKVPIYGRSHVMVGRGIVGGYVWTQVGNAAKLANITLRVINGTPPQEIPVEKGPDTPMFDWRQLQRWGIQEDHLPPGAVILFRELTVWQQYMWRIVAAIVVFVLQAFLIGALLVGRRRARRAQQEVEKYQEHLEQLVQDRTAELVVMRDQATAARDQAQAASQAKSDFLAKMSHELRTPLNAILGFSAMVRVQADLSEEHREDLTVVGNSGEHLLGLIDDVLDMAKIETGSVVVESAPIDLRRLVHDTVNMLRDRAQAKNLELLLDVSSRAPQFIRSDPAKLRQVLINLVANALKYTDEGSVIVRMDAKPRDGSQHLTLLLDVEDTGIGIDEEDQARIFDPFVQGGGASARKGTGLGLSLSRHFVELLGGTIRVDSTIGRGSRFHVEVPAQMAEASEVTADTGAGEQVTGLAAGQPDYRVLIVEDQRENWLLLQRLLSAVGFDVRVAEDGAQAINQFELWRPHFIWMDVRLPVLSGLEAARRIRELDGGKEVKIVAVTASAFVSQRAEVLAAGLDDFLRKPYRLREVFDCMARQLGVRYVYGPQAAAAGPPALLRPEDLAALPAALRDELEDAVVSLDLQRIALLVGQASEQNASLGSALEPLVKKLAYSPILRALRSCKSGLAEAGAP